MKKKIYRVTAFMLLLLIAALWGVTYFGENSTKSEEHTVEQKYDGNNDSFYDESHIMEKDDFMKYQVKEIGETVTFYNYMGKVHLTVLKCDIYDSIPEKYMDYVKKQRKHGVDEYLFINQMSYEEFALSESVIIDLTLETNLNYPNFFVKNSDFNLYFFDDGRYIAGPTVIYNDYMTFLDINMTNRVEQEEACGIFTFEGNNKVFHLLYACSREDYEAGNIVMANYQVDVYLLQKNFNKQYAIKITG